MSKLKQWQLEKQSRKETINRVFSTNPGKNRKGQPKGTNPSRQTSSLMSTTFRYRNKTLATIVQFMQQQGESPTSISQILRYGLEGFETLILDKYPEFTVQSEAHAKQVLSIAGINTTNTRLNKLRQNTNLTIESFEQNTPSQTLSQPNLVDQAMAEFNKQPMTSQQSIESIRQNYSQPMPGMESVTKPTPNTRPRLTVVKRNGISKQVLRDGSKEPRQQALIVCLDCLKPSYVLLDFIPTSETIDADCCPNCDGVTKHQIAENPNSGLSPMEIPINKFRQEMLSGGQTKNEDSNS